MYHPPTCETCEYPTEIERAPLEQTTQTPYCSYTPIINSFCLKFSIDYPIRAEYEINDCGLNIYFTDGLNQRRYIYFQYDSQNHLILDNKFKVITGYEDGDCKEPIYSNQLDCNKINYHPTHESPCLELVDVISGGSLKAGTYQFIPYYSDADGNSLGNPLPATNPVPIFTKEITFETNYGTDRAIALKFSNLANLVYEYYTVIVAETIDNFTDFKKIGTFPTLKNSIIYTGNEDNLSKLTPNDVFYRNPFYNTAANITKANNYLFFSELTEFPKPNLQRVANRIKLNWQTTAIPEAVYKDPKNTYYFRSYNRDEVYPMGIIFVTENGEELGPFHIPGPNKQSFLDVGINPDQIISNQDVIDRENCLTSDPNCCQPNGLTSLDASLSISCSDKNCTEQGSTVLNISFPQATPIDLTLWIGNIFRNNDGSIKFAQGWELYPVPSYAQESGYHYGCGNINQTFRPYVVNIPAGTTNFSATDIQVRDAVSGCDYTESYDSSRWVCHSCISGIQEVYIKTVTPGYELNLSTTQTVRTQNPQFFPNAPTVPLQIHKVESTPLPPDPDCIDCSQNLSNKRWQVYNTGYTIGTPHQSFINCDHNSVWEWGSFAYWESTEKYPNNEEKWGELCGKPIRHHKFPDSLITHIHDGLNSSKKFQDNNIVFPIGVLVNQQSIKDALTWTVANNIIKQSDKDRIKEYRIIRGNRVGNESVVAKGLLFDMWNYSKDQQTYYYPNYPYNDLNDDIFISPTKSTYGSSTTSNPIPSKFNKTSRYTFHSPNVHFTNKKIGTELKLETLEYGESEGYFNEAEEQARYRFLSTFAATLAFGAGLAAAFSAEKEKECKTIVTRSMQQITGSLPGPILTLPAIPGANYVPVLPPQSLMYEDLTGLPIGIGGVDPINPATVTEVQRNTCRGKTLQLLGVASLNPAGILTGGVMQVPYLLVIGMKEMQIIRDLIKALLPLKNLSIQYNSIGKYNNYSNISNSGNKIRQINRSAYLDPIFQSINEAINVQANQLTSITVNNHQRERSVYLKIDNTKPLPNPSVQDNSRFSLNQAGLTQNDLYKRVYRNISSYYSSIKNYLPDQYGRISDIDYLETSNCTFNLSKEYPLEELTRFGGDTFINRFALKRKLPFFLQTRFKQIDEIDVQYSELGNVGYPNYYFNSDQPLLDRFDQFNFSLSGLGNFYQNLIGVNKSRLDAKTSKAFYQSGFIHLYSYGIPYFFTESDVNVDYRHGQNNREKDFFPHQSDLNFWLQEKNVPITEDNYYFYNSTYSKQNKENIIGIERDNNDLTKDCRIDHPNRIIVSDRGNNDSRVDEFLRFRGNNFYDFPSQKGQIISADGIENDKVLVRFENSAQIFNAYSTIQTDSGNIAVGNAGLFQSPPQEFSNTKLGFAGAQSSELLQTEFGHIWPDLKRGQIFSLQPNAKGLDELAKDGMRNWFEENLKLQILKDFPTLTLRDATNNFKGIGITMSYDRRLKRFFLTKLDYKKTDPQITYDKDLKVFKKGTTEVQLTDKRYFCNKSFTVSYNFLSTGLRWSFHSFTPNYYVDQLDYTQSGLNSQQSSLWSHNVSNKSYQVYYGKLYPFIVETLTSPAIQNTTLHSIEFETEAIRYHDSYNQAYSPNITFNKAELYNERQSSGPLNLNIRDENNFYQSLQFPKVEDNQRHILLTNKEGKYRFNDFYDTVTSPNFNNPIYLYDCSNSTKQLNLKALNLYKPDTQQPLMRAKQTRIRLIQDKDSNHKLLLHFATIKSQASII